jgi:hypothetical protein
VWDSDVIEIWSTMSFMYALVIKGRLIQYGQPFVIVNIYAPCDTTAKQALWDQLSTFIRNHDNENLGLTKLYMELKTDYTIFTMPLLCQIK